MKSSYKDNRVRQVTTWTTSKTDFTWCPWGGSPLESCWPTNAWRKPVKYTETHGTLILKHTASWNTQHHKTQSALKHITWHGILKRTASWNTQRHKIQSTLKHMALWNTQYPETYDTLDHMALWNAWYPETQYSETHGTLKHTVPWNTQYSETHGLCSSIKHAVGPGYSKAVKWSRHYTCNQKVVGSNPGSGRSSLFLFAVTSG